MFLTVAGSPSFLATCLNIFTKYWPSLAFGIKNTLIIALSGTLIGLLLGLIVGGLRAIKVEKQAPLFIKVIKKIYDIIATIYIEDLRGTPMMVQAAFIYYALLHVFNWSPNIAGIFVVSINTGAYMSEIIRSGIQAVDPGQVEGARSLGMSAIQTMKDVVLPQAIKNAFPAIGNEFIVNIKDSSVLSIISVTELMFQSKRIAGSNLKMMETYFVTATLYLCLTLACSIILRIIEHRLSNSNSSLPQSDTNVNSLKLTTRKDN